MDPDRETIETLRHRLEHEDNLVNQRLSWIVTSQAFLLTGYAILLNGPAEVRSERLARHQSLLMWLIPIIGLVTVALIWLAIIGALMAMHDLRERARTHPSAEAGRIQGRSVTLALGMSAPLVIPIVFVAMWLVIILA